MKVNIKGFTLLELLVVVLIIGILTAIALPQYQKAVEKSKATQALILLQSMYESATVYELTTGNWPRSANELYVDIPDEFIENGEWNAKIENVTNGTQLGVKLTRISGKYTGTGFAKYKKHPYTFIPKEVNLCFEQKKNMTPLYNGTQGSYCNKIFKGKPVYVGTANWSDIWSLQ